MCLCFGEYESPQNTAEMMKIKTLASLDKSRDKYMSVAVGVTMSLLCVLLG